MSERMTDEAIREAVERAEKATPGPWKRCEDVPSLLGFGHVACDYSAGALPSRVMIEFNRNFPWEADRAFVIAARDDVPALAAEALARGAEVVRLRAELAAADRSVDRLSACVSNGDGTIRRMEREAEALRAEVADSTRRAEAAEAEVARLTRAALRTSQECPGCGEDISFRSAAATVPDAPMDAILDGEESFCRSCNVRARWTGDAETTGTVVLDYDEDRAKYRAEVAALRAEVERLTKESA